MMEMEGKIIDGHIIQEIVNSKIKETEEKVNSRKEVKIEAGEKEEK